MDAFENHAKTVISTIIQILGSGIDQKKILGSDEK